MELADEADDGAGRRNVSSHVTIGLFDGESFKRTRIGQWALLTHVTTSVP